MSLRVIDPSLKGVEVVFYRNAETDPEKKTVTAMVVDPETSEIIMEGLEMEQGEDELDMRVLYTLYAEVTNKMWIIMDARYKKPDRLST